MCHLPIVLTAGKYLLKHQLFLELTALQFVLAFCLDANANDSILVIL